MIPPSREAGHVSIALAVLVYLLSTNIFGAIFGGIFIGIGHPEWAPIVAVVTGWAPVIWLMFFKWQIAPDGLRSILPPVYKAKYFCICLLAFPLAIGSLTFICFEIRALLPSFPTLTLALFSNSLLPPLGGTSLQLCARVLLIVLFIPACEELFFRGVLLSACMKQWGGMRALVFTSLLFGMLHGDWLGHILYGFVWGGITLYTASVFWAILSHILLNAITVIASIKIANQSFYHDLSLFASNCEQLNLIGAACILISISGAAYLAWRARSRESIAINQ